MCLLLAVVQLCQAQAVLDAKLSGNERHKKLSQVLDSLQRTGNARFFYKSQWIDDIVFGDTLAGKTVREALEDLFHGTELSYVEIYPHSIVIVKDPTQMILRQQAIGSAKREQRTIQTRRYGSAANPIRKKTVNIRGTIVDSRSNEPLPGASIQLSDSTANTTTNAEGQFALRIRPGDYILNIGYVNYDEATIDLSAYDDGVMNVGLEEMPRVLEEVVVQDRAEREITSSRIGQAQVSVAEVKRAPTILGEADLVKRVQTLPGVTTVGEAAAGFNVRGGSVDQNLILYDGLPVFNSSHAFGFLSSFNSQAIRDVSFYRAGIPAEFGGRVSSVLDIRSKEGSYEVWGGNAGIGMITANAMINGPLKKNKSSMLAAIRSTYSNWLIHSIRTNYADLKRSNLAFYDATLKLNHLLSPDTKLSFTGYMSKDGFRLFGDSTYQWFNRLASARIDHRFSSNFSADVTAGISAYSYKVINSGANAFELSYDLKTTSVKAGFNYQNDRHRLSFGTHLQYFTFNPGALMPTGESSVQEVRMGQQRSFENALYAHDIFTLSERMTVEGGVRVPVFSSLYGERVTYTGVEPRVGLRFVTGRNSSIKAGYNRMYQFLHLISNTAAVTPVDVWQPANKDFKPQVSHHASIGYFRNFKEKKYEFSAEGFYKTIDNILDFRDGARLILNDRLNEDLLQGKARAYGIETMMGIVSGKRLTGSVNYTYSRSFRTVAGETESTSVNHGNEYPSNFDQPHVVNLSWKYSLTRRYHLTGMFTYHTGRPVSAPLSGYFYENMMISGFSERNQFRIPDYHRLDLAVVIEGNHKRKKIGDGTWVISVYNVYARKNAYSVFYKTSEVGLLKPYRLAIIGTALPSITYNFSF